MVIKLRIPKLFQHFLARSYRERKSRGQADLVPGGFIAPHHFPIGLAHNLLRAERRDRASRNEIDLFLLDFHRLEMRLHNPLDRERFEAIMTLGCRYMLSAYDAA
jgi:predicted nucleic acid-binding protein